MSVLLALLALAASPLPGVVRTVPGGPVLLPELGVAVWQGEALRAEPLCQGPGGGLWRTRDGAVTVWVAGSDSVWARAWGRATSPTGVAHAAYLCASQVNPLGGPPEAGALIRAGEALWRVAPDGACERLDELNPRPEWAPLFVLDTEQDSLGTSVGTLDWKHGAVDATGALGLQRGALFADLSWLLPLRPAGDPRAALPGVDALHLTRERALGVCGRWGGGGPCAPLVVDTATGQAIIAPRAWLTDLPTPRPWARTVARAGAEWLELPSLAAELRSGEVRLNWSDPAAWAPSPDGKWAAVLDAYGSARPFATRQSGPTPLDIWLAVVPEGDEFESPLRRPSTRWAVSVSREYGGPWPPLDLAPVWSPGGRSLACGRLVLASETGAVVARLEAGAVPVAFADEDRLLYGCRDDGEPMLREWDLRTGLSEDLDPRRAAPLG